MVCFMALSFNNQEIFTVILSKLSWSAFGGGGGGGGGGRGQDLSISYLKQNCFSHGERFFKKIYTQTVLLEMSCENSG